MEEVKDKDGNVIRRSRNLRGIRDHVADYLVNTLDVSRLSDGGGRLSVTFVNGDSYETNFADFKVLCLLVRGWRNVCGVLLTINGAPADYARWSNPELRRLSQ